MFRVLARASRAVPSFATQLNHRFPILPNRSQSLIQDLPNKLILGQVSLLHHSTPSSSISQLFGFSSSATTESSEKGGNGGSDKSDAEVSEGGDTQAADQTKESDSDEDLSIEDLVKLLTEKEELLKQKHKEVGKMQDKVLHTYAEMENVMDRTRREAENTKKFSIQNFAKSLLDVADNLSRAASVTKTSFAKLDQSENSAAATPLLKTLLEGVEMTEKQLAEVLKKYGIEKYDPTDVPFDPHRHDAVFQVSDHSKPPGTVAQVLKPGYVLHDRVIRPAEVGVTREEENATGGAGGN